jgi:mevalonate kinase
VIAIPGTGLPVAARAPGKCILFGEHSVVHGRPELLLAIDLYTQVAVRASERMLLNGDAQEAARHPYLKRAIEELWDPSRPPLAFTSVSRVPASAGLGSSAAFASATATALLAATGGSDRSQLAQAAFDVERGAQGIGSPGDTSASVAGGCISVNAGTGGLLWEVAHEDRRWQVRRVTDPGWVWLVAYCGVPRNTAQTVRAVGRRLAEPDGPAVLDRFEEVARAGIDAVLAEDRIAVGRRFAENQELLRTVGVSHPRLEAILDAVAPAVEGAKLTGAGAGGSIVALPIPGREIEAQRRAAKAGALAFVVRASPGGAHVVEAPSSG